MNNTNVKITKELVGFYNELTRFVKRHKGPDRVQMGIRQFRRKYRTYHRMPSTKQQPFIKPHGREPQFRYKHWHVNNPGKAHANNCYAYSTGVLRMKNGNRSHGLVGEMCQKNSNKGTTLNTKTRCRRMLELIMCDIPGATSIARNTVPKKGFHKVAVVFDKNKKGVRFRDYHFYRQHANGLWSHKSGWQQMPKLHDASGKLIFDPRKADRKYPESNLNYNVFCAYIQVPSRRSYNNQNSTHTSQIINLT